MPQGTYTNKGFSGTQEDETILSSAEETKIQVSERQNKLPDSQAVTFSWSNLTVKVSPPSRRCCGLLPARGSAAQPKEILSNACGVVRPGEFLAIMGASGAGKSTLMNTLLFRNLAGLEVSGKRMANGEPVTPSSLLAVSGYVQQDDLFFGSLTVREHLIFQALLRMDRDVPKKQRMERVEEVIQELGLSKCSNTQIGVPGKFKGISGGQMKRLAFASEVLTNPALLFCDEPTSGLDSVMAASVVEVMRTLASQGRTIVCTIHQPSSQIFHLFDKVLFMAEGRTAYIGDVPGANSFFERCGFPCPTNYNPADHYLQVLAVVPGQEEASHAKLKEICDDFEISEKGIELTKTSSEATKTSSSDSFMATTRSSPYKASWGEQFTALLWRSWLSIVKDPMILRIRIGTSIFIALILGAVYFGQELSGEENAKGEGIMNINGVLFLLITNMTFSNMFAVINVFCLELPIFLREHFNGMYRTDTYFICRQLAELPIFLFLPLVFLAIIYYMVGLNAPFVKFAITVAIIELMTQAVASFGYLISCIATSIDMALGLGPPFLIPLMLFGGLFLNNGSTPVYFIWAKYLSWFYYTNELLAINQWDGIEGVSTACPTDPSQECPVSGDQILSNLNFDKENFWLNIGLLAALAVAFRCLAFLALLAKTYRRH